MRTDDQDRLYSHVVQPDEKAISVNVAAGVTGVVQEIDCTGLRGGSFTIIAVGTDTVQFKPVYPDGQDVGAEAILVYAANGTSPVAAAALTDVGTFWIRYLACSKLQIIKTGTNAALKISGLLVPQAPGTPVVVA